jgi:hypothetical protein
VVVCGADDDSTDADADAGICLHLTTCGRVVRVCMCECSIVCVCMHARVCVCGVCIFILSLYYTTPLTTTPHI